MSTRDKLTLAQLDYELHCGPWPIDREPTEDFIRAVHPDQVIDRRLLVTVLGEYLGQFDTLTELAKAVTAQSLLHADIRLDSWPFTHIDWQAAGEILDESIADGEAGTIVRVAANHFFAPTPTSGSN